MRFTAVMAMIAVLPPGVAPAQERLDPLGQWGQWRGPTGNGVALRGNPPLHWSEERNVRWKVALPGKGHSTPVVWGDRIFLTTAVPHGERLPETEDHPHGAHHNMPANRKQRFVVMAVDRRDGSVLWQTTVRDLRPHESTHQSGSWASGSASTDGRHVIAFFGSAGLFGLDLDGKLLWQADLGDMQVKHGHGEGSTPALHGDTVVVNWDHEGQSLVLALDKSTGEERWRKQRDEGTSWSSPLIVEHAGKAQAIIPATNRVRAYDLETGAVIWECGGLSGNVVATPVAAAGQVYVANSYDARAMLAIRLEGARGDITGTEHVVWTRNRDTPYVPSPVLYEDTLCFLKHYQGRLTCVEAKAGKTLFGPERLPGIRNVYASLTAAAGRIYVFDLDGNAVVLKHGSRLELLAENTLSDSFAASPAFVGDEMILRGERNLYCIAEPSAD